MSVIAMTVVHSLLYLVFIIWPIFIIIFLMKKKHVLEEKTFLEKFSSMTLGNKTEHPSSFLYSAFFCIRRFAVVMCYVILTESDDKIIILVLMII